MFGPLVAEELNTFEFVANPTLSLLKMLSIYLLKLYTATDAAKEREYLSNDKTQI
jgi:hypothetical protein